MAIFPPQYSIYANDTKSSRPLHMLHTNGPWMQKTEMVDAEMEKIDAYLLHKVLFTHKVGISECLALTLNVQGRMFSDKHTSE